MRTFFANTLKHLLLCVGWPSHLNRTSQVLRNVVHPLYKRSQVTIFLRCTTAHALETLMRAHDESNLPHI